MLPRYLPAPFIESWYFETEDSPVIDHLYWLVDSKVLLLILHYSWQFRV
jgi:hypothetical protein